MCRFPALLCVLVLLTPVVVAQTEPASSPLDSGISLRVTTRMVVVDAVVTDKKGHPVADLGQHGLLFHFQMDALPGELRLVVRDNLTGLIGTTIIPMAEISAESRH